MEELLNTPVENIIPQNQTLIKVDAKDPIPASFKVLYAFANHQK
jgi:hypothetical protein